MEFPIPAIEEFERDFDAEEPAISSEDRWSLHNLNTIPERTKKPVVEPILRWKSTTSYNYKSVIFNEIKTERFKRLKIFALKSIFNEEKLLGFKGDPDDNNFVPISKETLDRAKHFFSPYLAVFSTVAYAIKIMPGPDGSVDIKWKNAKKELLLNIPADKNEHAMFYGDDYGKLSIKGTVEVDSLHPLVLAWLMDS
jgi:hypothetical protein